MVKSRSLALARWLATSGSVLLVVFYVTLTRLRFTGPGQSTIAGPVFDGIAGLTALAGFIYVYALARIYLRRGSARWRRSVVWICVFGMVVVMAALLFASGATTATCVSTPGGCSPQTRGAGELAFDLPITALAWVAWLIWKPSQVDADQASD